jgi:hypothetical protein
MNFAMLMNAWWMTQLAPVKSERLDRAKARLRELGYSNRTAADALGVRFEHLNRVLNGHRESEQLLNAIEALPESGRNWNNRKEAAQ